MSSRVTVRGPAWIVSPMRSLLSGFVNGWVSSRLPGAALDGGALHVVEAAAHAAHLRTAPGAAWAAVHEHRQRGAVAGGLGGGVIVEDEEAAVPGRGAKHDLAGEVRVL